MGTDINIEGFDSIIREAVQQRVQVGIIESLRADSDGIVERLVDAALEAKTKDGYREIPFIEKMAKDAVQNATKAAVAEWVETVAPKIKAEIERQLGTKKTIGRIASALIETAVSAATSTYRINVNFEEMGG